MFRVHNDANAIMSVESHLHTCCPHSKDSVLSSITDTAGGLQRGETFLIGERERKTYRQNALLSSARFH